LTAVAVRETTLTQDDTAALARLLRQSHTMRPEDLPRRVDEAARLLGAAGCSVWLVSRDQRLLQQIGPGREAADGLRLDGTVAGRAFRAAEVLATGDGSRLWVPLVDGAERLGALEVLTGGPAAVDALREPVLAFAALVAELVVSKGQYTDTYERVRRALPMGIPAEMLWRQLPPLAFAADRFVVTAQLEPWHEVGGDAFDYSIDGELLRFAVFDAMGHGLGATLLASVALAAYRNARRSGMDLVATAKTIDETLGAQFGDESFVTAVLAELDLRDGTVRTLTAAHPAPLLVRDGRSLGELGTDPGFPLGFGDRDDTVVQSSLEPGDRILMFSDGVVEARGGDDGEFFGTDRLVDLLVRAESHRLPPPETLRRLILAVLEHQQGMLQDDATLLMLEWAGDVQAVLAE
jgi:hypothetical protein